MMTSGGNRKPAKLDCGACTAGRCGISPACPSQPSVNATEPLNQIPFTAAGNLSPAIPSCVPYVGSKPGPERYDTADGAVVEPPTPSAG
jgi:hypothetical protein